ncbi:MAG: hypothetical protein HOK29_13575, partial [Candidatus Marinimicrobia bacterium]|nr:hypothetical protein [Candidatus Neomarinimicrobiota bacterium]
GTPSISDIPKGNSKRKIPNARLIIPSIIKRISFFLSIATCVHLIVEMPNTGFTGRCVSGGLKINLQKSLNSYLSAAYCGPVEMLVGRSRYRGGSCNFGTQIA